MTVADISSAAGVWWRSSVSAAPRDDHPTEPEMAERLGRERWETTLAAREGAIVGLLAVQRRDAWLRQLFVDPAAQGTGVGAALLAEAMRRMPAGFHLNTDFANARARRFYEARGLILVGVAPHPTWGNLQARYEWAPTGDPA